VHHPQLSLSSPGEERDLSRLLERARASAPGAFEELARRVRDRVRRWARHVTRDADDAEDVAQLVLLKLQDRLGDFGERSRFTTWLYSVTRNVALDRRRRERRRATLLARHQCVEGDDGAAVTEAPRAAAGDADRLARLVRAYFAELPERQRQVFELAEMRGRSAAEIAAHLGIEPATVRVTLLKARRAIRARMLAEHPQLLAEYREEHGS
jgi:RNA polymerase sigma factor (sigma-70 family)